MSLIADLAAGGARGLFSGIGSLAKDIRIAITGKDPVKMAEAIAKAQEIEAAAAIAQTDINKEEAKHPNWFVAGWRPFIGWTCGIALAFHYVIAPFLVWFFSIFNVTTTVPTLDMAALMTLLFGMLGLGGYRSYEKKQGIARN